MHNYQYEKILGWCAVGIVAGIVLFFRGFYILWKKNLIQNTPTSKIRSIAVGFIEVLGKTIADYLLTAPYSAIPCVFYHVIVERLETDSRGRSRWVKDSDYTSDVPFYLQDDTGCVVVDPLKTEAKLPLRYFKRSGNFRYKEYYIKENEFIYVLGTAKKTESIYDKAQKEMREEIKEIVNNPDEKIKLDTNKDNWIDKQEWTIKKEEIRQKIRQQLEKDKKEAEKNKKDSPVSPHLKNIAIGQGKGIKNFIISTMSEKTLVKTMKIKSAFSIFGGMLLTLICLSIALHILQIK